MGCPTNTTAPRPHAEVISVAVASPADAESVIDLLSVAFEADPPCRWAWPDAGQFSEAFPAFVKAFAGSALECGSAHFLPGQGAAMWLPPGAEPDEGAIVQLVEETVSADRRATMLALFEEMGSFHPDEPFWHLALIGVEPRCQGRGIGATLLQYGLAICDRQQAAAYLEATTPRSASLYEQHGFEALGLIQCGDVPPIVPMLRRRNGKTCRL